VLSFAIDFYSRLSIQAEHTRESLIAGLTSSQLPALHWIDHVARYYKANGMYTNKDLFLDLLWTAHGVKLLDPVVALPWKFRGPGDVILALPTLDELLNKDEHIYIVTELRRVSHLLYDDSITVQRNVVRVPLQLPEVEENIEEKNICMLRLMV